MIALLTGRLRRKSRDYLVIDVNGVGYEVHIPLSTSSALPGIGEEVSLHIHTHVREDTLALFGFIDEAEKDAFLLLLGVSGIGPRLALGVLSSLSVPDIVRAIQSSDDSKLCSIPGIGKKTAARMILELRDKVACLAAYSCADGDAGVRQSGNADDAVSALVNLGYKKPLAEEAVKKVVHRKSGLTVEELIREGLSVLTSR
ncbi:MAG TPA: Holliday junction branch migration protein RuvA [Nitrospirota bacterium]|nr:Holliday junction branch migration protein RuvA [Nitrospirota bacterium]